VPASEPLTGVPPPDGVLVVACAQQPVLAGPRPGDVEVEAANPADRAGVVGVVDGKVGQARVAHDAEHQQRWQDGEREHQEGVTEPV
jgi:hypothetical protein